MANVPYPLINGHRYSWASIEIRIKNNIIIGFKSMNYTHTLTPGIVRGTGPSKIGRTRGEEDATGDFEIYRPEFDNLVAALGGAGYKEVPFDVVISYADLGMPVIIDTAIGCRITETAHSNAEGTDTTVVSCSLDIMKILENGIDPLTPITGISPT